MKLGVGETRGPLGAPKRSPSLRYAHINIITTSKVRYSSSTEAFAVAASGDDVFLEKIERARRGMGQDAR